MPIPLQNPYSDKGNDRVCGKISNSDWRFFKTLFPADGTIDATVSTLFKNLIDELRSIDAVNPIEPAWYIDAPGYHLILSILQRRAARQPAGQEGPRDDSPGVSGIRQMDVDPSEQRPDPQSSPAKRRKSARKETEKTQKSPEGLSDVSAGVAD